METIVKLQRASVSEPPANQSRAWARHSLEFVQNNWGREDLANQGLDAMLASNLFQVYVVTEIDQKLAELRAALDAEMVALKKDLLAAINDMPGRIFPDEKRQEVTQAVLSALQDQMAARDERLRSELKDELLRELRAASPEK